MQTHGRIEGSRAGKVAVAAVLALVSGAVLVSVVPSILRPVNDATAEPSYGLPAPARDLHAPAPDLLAPGPDPPIRWPTEMTSGTYGGMVGTVSFTFSLTGRGWSSGDDEGSLFVPGDPSRGWLRFWNPDQVYSDPCMHMLKPHVGPTAAELVDAIATIPGMRVTGVSDVQLGENTAKRIEFAPKAGTCISHDTYLWQAANASDDNTIRRPRLADSRITVWIVDVNGDRMLIDSDVGADNLDAAAEIGEIVGSVRVVPLSVGLLRYVSEVSRVCVAARDRLASDPLVARGISDDPPRFATSDAASAHADAAARILDDVLSELRSLPEPADVTATGIDQFGLIAMTIEYLHQISAAAWVGDDTGVTGRLAGAYMVTNRGIAMSDSPTALWLLDASLSGCRLPSTR
jgi:hypothetical protein